MSSWNKGIQVLETNVWEFMSKVWRKTSVQGVGSSCFSELDDFHVKAEYMDLIFNQILNV